MTSTRKALSSAVFQTLFGCCLRNNQSKKRGSDEVHNLVGSESDFDAYNNLSDQINDIDPNLIIVGRLLGGGVSCMFKLNENCESQHQQQAKDLIEATFRAPMITFGVREHGERFLRR